MQISSYLVKIIKTSSNSLAVQPIRNPTSLNRITAI